MGRIIVERVKKSDRGGNGSNYRDYVNDSQENGDNGRRNDDVERIKYNLRHNRNSDSFLNFADGVGEIIMSPLGTALGGYLGYKVAKDDPSNNGLGGLLVGAGVGALGSKALGTFLRSVKRRRFYDENGKPPKNNDNDNDKKDSKPNIIVIENKIDDKRKNSEEEDDERAYRNY